MYNRHRRRKSFLGRIYSFAITWSVLSFVFPLFVPLGFLTILAISAAVAFLVGKSIGKREDREMNTESKYESRVGTKRTSERVDPQPTKREDNKEISKKSYGPEVDPIVEEGNRALGEMGRLYMSIKDTDVREKINEIMRITDKIMQDAIADPADIPQIKKFFTYYLPTTIKLLNSYDRMSAQGIEGENIDKSMKSITEMLDVAIVAYKKRLDSLFENQALDIETDIDVLNQLLEREGLSGKYDFTSNIGGAAIKNAADAKEQKGC